MISHSRSFRVLSGKAEMPRDLLKHCPAGGKNRAALASFHGTKIGGIYLFQFIAEVSIRESSRVAERKETDADSNQCLQADLREGVKRS
jgi:hypothetical protein